MQVGTVLRNRYRITSFLGSGGFGETYLAEDLDLPGQPQCVVKQLKPHNSNPILLQVARVLFDREAKTLYKLGNINDQIPRLFAHAEEDGQFYLVQEFIHGHTLSEELTVGQPWHEAAVLQLMREILEVLVVVHKNGVIHRDIKPSNLMRRHRDKKIVLIDFGSVKEINALTVDMQGHATTTVAIGSADYISPEQAYGNPQLSSDVYSVGVLGIQALLGRVPQKNPDTGSLIWRNLVLANAHLTEVLDKMTRYHFRDRYASAESALKALNLSPVKLPVTVLEKKKKSFPMIGVPVVFATVWLMSKLISSTQSAPLPIVCPFDNCTLKLGGVEMPPAPVNLQQAPNPLCKDDSPQSSSKPLRINREPLRQYLENELRKKYSSVQVKLDNALNFSQTDWVTNSNHQIKNKNWDIAFTLSPLLSLAARDRGYEFAFASNIRGQPSFSSSIYVRKDSDISSLKDINSSKKIALGNRNDLIGFYQPIYLLYGTSPSIESNYTFPTIRSMVLCKRVDIGVGPTQGIQEDPKLTILATSSVSVGGVYFSPQLPFETRKILKNLLENAPVSIRNDAAYMQGAEPTNADYEKVKLLKDRAQEIIGINKGEIIGVVTNVSRANKQEYSMTIETQNEVSYQAFVPVSVMKDLSDKPLSDLLMKQIKIVDVRPDNMRRLMVQQKKQAILR
jgi:serine/threonine protein kinase